MNKAQNIVAHPRTLAVTIAAVWAVAVFLNFTLLPGKYALRAEIAAVVLAPMPLIV